MLKKIKETLGKSAIKKALKENNRIVKSISYNEAKSVLVIYPIKDKNFQVFITKFINYLRGEIGFKIIKSIGFLNDKENPSFIDNSSKYHVINNDDLKFNLTPKEESYKEYDDHHFDILIDLSDDFNITLKYILAKSKASFKIGKYNNEMSVFYDFMIELPKDAPINELIDQINFYLKRINS